MQAFKLCFKILKKNLGLIIMYVCIFAGVGTSFAMMQGSGSDRYTASEASVAVINADGTAEVAEALIGYLDSANEIVGIEDDRKQIDDALFFRSAEYIIRIPAGFTERFVSDEPLPLEVFAVSGTMAEVNIKMQVEQFFGTLRGYLSNTDLPLGAALSRVNENLAVSSGFESIQAETDYSVLTFLFRWLTYSVVITMIVSIVPLMLSFTNPMVRMRNEIASVKRNRLATQRFLAYGIVAAAIFVIQFLVSLMLDGSALMTVRGGIMVLNLAALSVVALSLAFLLGMIIRSDIGVNIASNVVSLCFAFLSGAFVPQALLGKNILLAAHFLPTYWYVRNVEAAAQAFTLGGSFVSGQILGIGIMLGFAAVFFLAALAVNRYKRRIR